VDNYIDIISLQRYNENMSDQDFLEVKNSRQNLPNKNIIGIVVLVIFLIAGGFFVYKTQTRKQKQEQENVILKNVVTPEITKILPDKLQKETPLGFPKDILLNGKIKIIESYNASYAQNPNIKQATISFESLKSIQENYDFYSGWAKDNKWEIQTSYEQGNLMSLYAQKNQMTFNVAIIPKTSGNTKSEVNISYAEF